MTISWLHTDTSHAALFDELTKIAEAAPQKQEGPVRLKRLLPAAAAGALGIGGGYMLADWASMKFGPLRQALEQQHSSRSAQAAKVVLPILGGAAFMLADRYRRKIDETSREPAAKK